MQETSLEKLVAEKDFVAPLSLRAQLLFRLLNTLRTQASEPWLKRHYFQLQSEADEVESFLDDYGARYNKFYNSFTEIVASIRGFALAGMSLEHLSRRLEGYGVLDGLRPAEERAVVSGLDEARRFVREALAALFQALEDDARRLGLEVPEQGFPAERMGGDGHLRFSLLRNVGQEDLAEEEPRIAEVASKYLQACSMLEEAGIRRISELVERERFLHFRCTEELARVYEATVHNLQSAYDTCVKNTVLEARDARLTRLRGHISSTLHLLEAVTHLTHFVERHESGQRTEVAEQHLSAVVDRAEVRRITLNALLYPAYVVMIKGRALAAELLPSYTQVQSLEVEATEGITLHARPCSLIVGIVHHHGTPVEMEIGGKVCSAGSILELMIAVGSHPKERRFLFRGDINPLRDIGLLFQHDLGEQGLDKLPAELSYLRNS
jgi:phosphotransferase system HPr-like phosphotransfer protein